MFGGFEEEDFSPPGSDDWKILLSSAQCIDCPEEEEAGAYLPGFAPPYLLCLKNEKVNMSSYCGGYFYTRAVAKALSKLRGLCDDGSELGASFSRGKA